MVPVITPEQRKLGGINSGLARRAARLELLKLRAMSNQVPAIVVMAPAQPEPEQEEYIKARLLRVRLQLDRIDELMMTEEIPQALDRLAAAQAKLAEQERILSGRPLPGSRRPAPDRANRQTQVIQAPEPI